MLVAVLLGVVVPTLVFCVAGLEMFLFIREHFSKWTRKKVFPVAALVAVGMASFLRSFYYSIDPFAWRGTLTPCVLFSIDYISTAFLSVAFMLVLLGWAGVMLKFEELSGKRKPLMLLWKHLPVVCLVFSGIMLLVTIPSCVTSCKCDGNVCPEKTSDLIFYITWLLVQGSKQKEKEEQCWLKPGVKKTVAVLLSLVASIAMLVHLMRLKASSLVESNQTERVGRLTRCKKKNTVFSFCWSSFLKIRCLLSFLQCLESSCFRLAWCCLRGMTPQACLPSTFCLSKPCWLLRWICKCECLCGF